MSLFSHPSNVETPGASRAPLFELKGLGFRVGERPLLTDMSAVLEEGCVIGLVGPNGSGKSTLVKLLAGQQQPSEGSVSLLGRPLASYGERERARVIAYLPQFTPPAEGMTVRELANLGRFPWHGALGRFSRDDHARVDDALRATGMEPFANRLADSLSGGERQRAWLATMVAQDTRAMLLDEPTSALDVAHAEDVLALVRDLSRERGLTALVVLHDVNMAARFCDEILALKEGRLVARGKPAEILAPTVLAQIYGLAMDVFPHPRTGAPVAYVA